MSALQAFREAFTHTEASVLTILRLLTARALFRLASGVYRLGWVVGGLKNIDGASAHITGSGTFAHIGKSDPGHIQVGIPLRSKFISPKDEEFRWGRAASWARGTSFGPRGQGFPKEEEDRIYALGNRILDIGEDAAYEEYVAHGDDVR